MGVRIAFLLLVTAAFSFVSGEINEICKLDKESGNCGSLLHRYYFDKDTGKCERFVYTGCGGNENNFRYLYECERYCPGDLDLGDICSLGPEPGVPGTNISCMAYFPRYYFNGLLGECDTFIFGGCGGNHNNFYTKEECEKFCPPVPQIPFDPTECGQYPEHGDCRAYLQRFHYDKESGDCKEFTYGGCGGNRNNFKTLDECKDKCGGQEMSDEPSHVE